MERQRSFFNKASTYKLNVLLLTFFSCFLVLLSLYFIWAAKIIPPFHQETHIFIGFISPENSTSFSKPANATLFDSEFSAVSANLSVPAPEADVSELLPKKIGNQNPIEGNRAPAPEPEADVSELLPKKIGNQNPIEGNRGCDVTKGKWVFDDSYPLYSNKTCPYIDEGFNCEANGRSDKDYMKWRWQPKDCDIPRFNATKMLESIRGKRLVFVGDSLNRNQWESMLCLLMSAIKDHKKVYEARGRRITKTRGDYSFKFVEYKCTVEYYVTHFLVHESKARVGKKRVPTLRIDTMDRRSSRWRGADILVFNTAHWWSHHKTQSGVNYYQERDQVHPRLEVKEAFRRALTTWGTWVDRNVNPRKTRVFFRSSAPSHFNGGEWDSGGHCKEALRLTDQTTGTRYDNNVIVEDVIRQMKTKVTYLGITEMSSYRRDGHPSIYGRKSVDSRVQDCSHWCLPGVPDSWNELLYYHLYSNLTKGFL